MKNCMRCDVLFGKGWSAQAECECHCLECFRDFRLEQEREFGKPKRNKALDSLNKLAGSFGL